VIDNEREENERNKAFFGGRALDYDTRYHTYAEILAEFQSLPSQSNKVTYKSIGTTYEGRAIPSITVTNPGGSGKQAVFLECGIHAREWISTASCLWMANRLITNSSESPLLDKFEFIIVPTVNADGYVYTHTTNRSWRKTRSPQTGGCYGADPNRNWDTAFCAQGASTNPCSETYCGSRAFSEKCSQAMADLISSKAGSIAAYFAIHSYSQIWMYPWGYTYTLPPNNADLSKYSTAAVAAIRNTNGLAFTQGSIANAIYLASGSSIDWCYDKVNGCKVAFALELRDKGQYGFVLPPAQIKDACTETWNGIRAVLTQL
jgi:murein tripeptide amidase MpaA